jgi:hypothetical protein
MKEFGLTEKERVAALVESAYQVARERHRFGTGDGSLVFLLARELEALYEQVHGAEGLLYRLEMTSNMLSFYKELSEEEFNDGNA